MKKTWLVFSSVVALAAVPAQAQLFRPSVVNGALLGGVAGAIIGNNSGHGGHTGEGAAIGAVAGALLGAAIDNSRQPGYAVPVPAPAPVAYYPQPVYCEPSAPAVVYVEPAPVYVAPVRYVVMPQPRPVVVYQSYGYAPPRPVVVGPGWAGDCRRDYRGGGRGWR